MVTIANVYQSNGVIHVVDTVLMPKLTQLTYPSFDPYRLAWRNVILGRNAVRPAASAR